MSAKNSVEVKMLRATVCIIIILFILTKSIVESGECKREYHTVIDSKELAKNESKGKYLWLSKKEKCVYKWRVIGTGTCNLGMKCHGKLGTRQDGECDWDVAAVGVMDKKNGVNGGCGMFNFTAKSSDPNLNELELFMFYFKDDDGDEEEQEYVNCHVVCNATNDFETLHQKPIEIHSPPLPYYLTKEIYNASDNVNFVWPPRDDSEEEVAIWTVFGEHNCPVGINCTLTYSGDCTEPKVFVKVSDGSNGEQYYCGNVSFQVGPSNPKLLDLFLKINSPRSSPVIRAQCNAQCDPERVFKSLQGANNKRTDMRCVCGLYNKDDRIIGGENATAFEFPWQAAIVFAKTRTAFCGGTVINDMLILTAKHCVQEIVGYSDPESIEVLFHAHLLTNNRNEDADYNQVLEKDAAEKTQRYAVSEILTPDQFQRFPFDYDIVLLRLKTKINLGNADAPTPICLPPTDDVAYHDRLIGKMLKAVGWGTQEGGELSKVLKKVDVPYLEDKHCRDSVNRIGDKDNFAVFTARMMCAYFQNDSIVNANTCQGDSGGPLLFKQKNNQFVQVGVTSFGPSCFDKGAAGVYAKVSELMQWIDFHSRESDAKWCRTSME